MPPGLETTQSAIEKFEQGEISLEKLQATAKAFEDGTSVEEELDNQPSPSPPAPAPDRPTPTPTPDPPTTDPSPNPSPPPAPDDGSSSGGSSDFPEPTSPGVEPPSTTHPVDATGSTGSSDSGDTSMQSDSGDTMQSDPNVTDNSQPEDNGPSGTTSGTSPVVGRGIGRTPDNTIGITSTDPSIDGSMGMDSLDPKLIIGAVAVALVALAR